MTRHEKIGLTCTKIHTITLFHIFQFYVRYTSSANFIKFSIVCYSTCKSFIDNYFWAQSYDVSKSKKVIKFYVYISPIFSCQFTYIVYHIDACTISLWRLIEMQFLHLLPIQVSIWIGLIQQIVDCSNWSYRHMK